jgi:hypothetical protein
MIPSGVKNKEVGVGGQKAVEKRWYITTTLSTGSAFFKNPNKTNNKETRKISTAF